LNEDELLEMLLEEELLEYLTAEDDVALGLPRLNADSSFSVKRKMKNLPTLLSVTTAHKRIIPIK